MRKARAESKKVEVQSNTRRLDGLFSSESTIRVFYLLIGAAVIALVFRHLQYSTASICCGDFDGYYHIKWSQMLWE